jgi:BON domain
MEPGSVFQRAPIHRGSRHGASPCLTSPTAILNDPGLKVLQLNVETFKGVVQLSGFVDSEAMMALAVEVTRGVVGVKSVTDNMRMR